MEEEKRKLEDKETKKEEIDKREKVCQVHSRTCGTIKEVPFKTLRHCHPHQ